MSFIQSNSLPNFESVLNCLHFKTPYSKLQNLDALVLINVFKNKTECCSGMDPVDLRVPTKKTKDFSTFNVRNISRLSPSTRSGTAANL
jgi:hypothetical protein